MFELFRGRDLFHIQTFAKNTQASKFLGWERYPVGYVTAKGEKAYK